MYKIGDIARFSRVSVKALRLYDERGLLPPAYVDPLTGYRYYTAEQLSQLHAIRALKDSGFSLDEVRDLLRERLTPAQTRAILAARAAALRERMREDAEMLRRVETRLRQMEQEEKMPEYEVLVKETEPQLVAAIEGVVPDMEHTGPTFDRLYQELHYAEDQGGRVVGPAFDEWYDDSCEREAGLKVEAFLPLAAPVPESETVKMKTLPGRTVASTIHRGPFSGLTNAIGALVQWIEGNGYRIAGPYREIYLRYDCQRPEEAVTEVQFPITKSSA